MPVKVTGPKGEDVNHPGGEHILVVDGHLLIQSDGSDDMTSTVAIYAPGAWSFAKTPGNG